LSGCESHYCPQYEDNVASHLRETNGISHAPGEELAAAF